MSASTGQSALVEAIDAAEGQLRLVNGIIREALDTCECLRQAAQCAALAQAELAAARKLAIAPGES